MAATGQAAKTWVQGRRNRRAVARFGEFWNALQRVGNALAEAEKLAKNAVDASWWKGRGTRHWSIATADEVRSAIRGCRGSLRIVSAAAKRFEPQLIAKEWRR